MKFTNWKNPSIRQLLREYKIEHEMKGNKFWKDKRDFVNAVKQAKVESITPEVDSAIGYRSRTKDKKQLLGLIKGYRSYPKFRNEDTLNSIYQGYAKNNPMDRPIVVEIGGRRRVFSGNTRMDAAYHSGVNPEVLVVKASQLSAKLRLREFSALRKRIRVSWRPDGTARMSLLTSNGLRQIGKIETRTTGSMKGAINWVEIDPRFRGMGLSTKMYGEAMKRAPRGRLVSDNTQYSGGAAVWNRLQRNKGYRIRENATADGTDFLGGGAGGIASMNDRPLFVGRINDAARMQWAKNQLDERSLQKFKPRSNKEYFSAKLRLRELAMNFQRAAARAVRH